MLNKWIEEIEKRDLHVEGIRVLKNGTLWAEHRWKTEQPRLIHSCSKAFTSMAAGFAVDEGLFTPEGAVTELLELPQYAQMWKDLRVEHLLTMSSGHETGTLLFEERGKLTDWLTAFFETPPTYAPGTFFAYNNGCSYLVSAIIQKLSGKKLVDYLDERLFSPLGWETPHWAECPMGRSQGLSGLFLTTTQMADFGQLLLDNGAQDGRQIIPETWIRTAKEKHIDTFHEEEPDWSMGYGYFLWRCRHDCWRADGMLGQFIIVLERLNTVIAINSEETRMQEILDCVWEKLLPELEI